MPFLQFCHFYYFKNIGTDYSHIKNLKKGRFWQVIKRLLESNTKLSGLVYLTGGHDMGN